MTVTYTFASGNVISATELNTNFQDVLNELTGITVADLHASSGLLSTNLSDRYAIITENINLVPRYTFVTALAAIGPAVEGAFFMPNNAVSPGTEVWRKYLDLRSSKSAFLCAVSVYLGTRDPSATGHAQHPQVWVTYNGNVLGGSGVQLNASNTVFRLRNTNPFDNPLVSLSNDDYLSIGFGVSAAATNVNLNRLSATLTYKIELGA